MADNGVVHVIDAVITQTATAIEDREASAGNVVVYPNPASEFVNISFEVVNPSEIRIEMYDMIGQKVRIQDEGFSYEGAYNVEFPVSDLESGMYLIIINTGDSQFASKVRVVK